MKQTMQYTQKFTDLTHTTVIRWYKTGYAVHSRVHKPNTGHTTVHVSQGCEKRHTVHSRVHRPYTVHTDSTVLRQAVRVVKQYTQYTQKFTNIMHL